MNAALIQTRILYIGNHREIAATMYRLLNTREDWFGEVCGAEEAVDFCSKQSSFDIVLLGCGIDEETEAHLRSFFARAYPNSKLIQHYGGGGGLLANEILAAMTYSLSD